MASNARRDRQARNNRREQIFIEQRHAWVHYFNRIGAGNCAGYTMKLGAGVGKCPVCLKTTKLEDFTEEDAPQRSGVSLLGEPTTIVLTCSSCNGGANLAYEREAANPKIQQHFDLPGGCPAHGTLVDHSTQILRVADEQPLVMADIKSAFMLAFATFGYEWAVSNGLKPIRRAIRSGDVPDEGTAAVVRLTGSPGENTVLQFSGSTRGVAVVGRDGYAVLLSGPGTDRAPVLDGSATKVKSWPWPVTTGPHSNVWEARKSGNLFHADFCSKHGW